MKLELRHPNSYARIVGVRRETMACLFNYVGIMLELIISQELIKTLKYSMIWNG